MAMAKNKREVDDIDEAALLQSIYEQDTPPAVSVPSREPEKPAVSAPEPEKTKEVKEPVKRRRGNADYGSLFLQRNEFKTRLCVYISRRIHTTISEIVKVISDREITVGGYIDSILMEHLETHRDEIMELYNSELSRKNGKNLMEF
jgi:hypothetical protein